MGVHPVHPQKYHASVWLIMGEYQFPEVLVLGQKHLAALKSQSKYLFIRNAMNLFRNSIDLVPCAA